MPNSESNWAEANFGGGGGLGYTGSAGLAGGYTGSMGEIGYTGSAGEIGYTGSAGIDGATGAIGYTGSAGIDGATGAIGYTGSAAAGSDIDLTKILAITNNTEATSTDTGSLQTQGGASIKKDLYIGGNLYVNGDRILKQKIALSEAPPDNPNIGDIWYDLLDGGSYQYIGDDTGSFWIQFGSSI